jgi:hypothetical protein
MAEFLNYSLLSEAGDRYDSGPVLFPADELNGFYCREVEVVYCFGLCLSRCMFVSLSSIKSNSVDLDGISLKFIKLNQW